MSSPVDPERELLRRAKAIIHEIMEPPPLPLALGLEYMRQLCKDWMLDMEAWEK